MPIKLVRTLASYNLLDQCPGLQHGGEVDARNKRGRTPLHVAAIFSRNAILERLLTAGEAWGLDSAALRSAISAVAWRSNMCFRPCCCEPVTSAPCPGLCRSYVAVGRVCS